ncbi:MAG: hypothetical protein JGK24_15135 [Microcoleus sp. PH2017_29_MFU_D_A]|uniref:hypothetical protein n=1 Tax=unclassified Microcoleus TaxID=2642155 RepID=UPI001DB54138|nr:MULTISPECIES: hypothetical protein [unclassified Microcoleus]MCC3416497.1 hypothetical protein [Microcoleus sp. PH2017_07_MST_O_A]MCC3507801.1 hypothetical protein [Microcoleus sp. PH2017_17_BER_D_A]MCC3423813.1 hypothetical protein [Microcoleus sp. PH2017_01_SCD_O_A]MCC3452804.1 hypothetical protein [Microcoleus sp. PH2017_08_TRC_O_A]MCC3604513.1 hypothetical protein [Microcoleus sp. PH2017_29_MFU_D_A]
MKALWFSKQARHQQLLSRTREPMATKNFRIVGYLPAEQHQKLRDYMTEESLTESAALVKIIKQFFETAPALSAEAVASETRENFARLQAEIAGLQGRVAALEAGIQRQFKSSPPHFAAGQPAMKLRPLKAADLAKRLGVSAETIENAALGGSAAFREWSKRRDPASRAWLHQGNLFYPQED